MCEGLSIIKVYNLNTKYKFHVAIMTAFLLSASTKTAAAVRGGGWSGEMGSNWIGFPDGVFWTVKGINDTDAFYDTVAKDNDHDIFYDSIECTDDDESLSVHSLMSPWMLTISHWLYTMTLTSLPYLHSLMLPRMLTIFHWLYTMTLTSLILSTGCSNPTLPHIQEQMGAKFPKRKKPISTPNRQSVLGDQHGPTDNRPENQ